MKKSTDIVHILIDDQPLGRMVLSPDYLCLFEYDGEFLSNGFSISPFYLPLRSGLFTARREPFNGLFGVFNDSLPDGWGNLLVDRYLLTQGVKPRLLSPLDRLSIVGTSGMGALQYIPDKHIVSGKKTNDISFLANEVSKILSEVDYNTPLAMLAEKGGSSGGARPKVLLNINGEPWMVKFPSSLDLPEIGSLEYTFSLVAKKCGIEMSETKLLEGKYFAIRRFDRVKNQRVHMHTASGLLYASHRFPSLDYIDLIKATMVLTKDSEEAYKLFRLMVFNVLTGNKDDHAKNFSFLYQSGKWQLSPAYDLVPSEGFNGNHSTTIAGKGNPGIEDMFKVASETGLKLKRVENIFDEVYENSLEIRLRGWK
ncbi:MAG: type II toxin-antitoxin system HipA family toxin [Bacteroidetes bacterium]|nr:MAG: type II toxin-antitoxin system HipA family toxin [Bacteroidota bacterium]